MATMRVVHPPMREIVVRWARNGTIIGPQPRDDDHIRELSAAVLDAEARGICKFHRGYVEDALCDHDMTVLDEPEEIDEKFQAYLAQERAATTSETTLLPSGSANHSLSTFPSR